MSEARIEFHASLPPHKPGRRVLVAMEHGSWVSVDGDHPHATVGPAGELWLRCNAGAQGPVSIIAPGRWLGVEISESPEVADDA